MLDRDGMAQLIRSRRILVTAALERSRGARPGRSRPSRPAGCPASNNGRIRPLRHRGGMRERFPALLPVALLARCAPTARKSTGPSPRKNPRSSFHAAALKHLPMVEANLDRGRALTTVRRHRNVAEAAFVANGTSLVVMNFGLDKAVNPAMYGRPQALADILFCHALRPLNERGEGASDPRNPLCDGALRQCVGLYGSSCRWSSAISPPCLPLTVTDPEVTPLS